jgi:hypothetical protein
VAPKSDWRSNPDEFAQRFEAVGFNLTAMAEEYGANVASLRMWRRRHGIDYPPHINPKGNHRTIAFAEAPPLVPIEDDELHLEGDWAVSSDWHAPITRYDVLHRMIDDAHAAGLTRLIIAGDLTNQDALTNHEDKQAGAHMGAEIEHLHYSITTALDAFDEIVISVGNHDRHLAQKAKVSFDKSLRMLLADVPAEKYGRITVTGRDYAIVHTDAGPWRICHTYSYSRLPLNYPNRLALRHGMHIAAGHRHHHAIGIAANGKTIVELGGLMDPARLKYANKWTNDLPEMQNGYGLLVGGRMRCPMLS